MVLARLHRVLLCGHSPGRMRQLEPSQMFLGADVLLFVSGPQVSCLLTQMTHSHRSSCKACLQMVMVNFMCQCARPWYWIFGQTLV